jgi:hypothetical protein
MANTPQGHLYAEILQEAFALDVPGKEDGDLGVKKTEQHLEKAQ